MEVFGLRKVRFIMAVPPLICCDGMIRSGSAFQYNLVCALLEKMGSCVRHGRLEREEEWLSAPVLEWAQDSNSFHVAKCARFPQEFQMARDGLARICYIQRDIRDVAVAAKYKWGLTGDGLLELLDRAVMTYQVLTEAGAFGTPWLLHQRYEDVYRDTAGAIWEIAQFLEVDPSPEIVEEVVKDCSLEVMVPISRSKPLLVNYVLRSDLARAANAIKRVLPPPLNGSWGLRKSMLRVLPKVEQRTLMAHRHIEPTRGEPGAWRDQLDENEQELITAQYQDYLNQAGYPL